MVRAVRELAAIVLVCARAVEGIVDALQASARPRVATATPSWSPQPSPLVDSWEFDDADQ